MAFGIVIGHSARLNLQNQPFAGKKSVFPDKFKACVGLKGAQSPAIPEGSIANGRYRGIQVHGRKQGTVFKSAVVDATASFLLKQQGVELGTVCKGIFSDKAKSIRNGQFP